MYALSNTIDSPNRANQRHRSLDTPEIAFHQLFVGLPQVCSTQGGAETHPPVDFQKSPFSAANKFNKST